MKNSTDFEISCSNSECKSSHSLCSWLIHWSSLSNEAKMMPTLSTFRELRSYVLISLLGTWSIFVQIAFCLSFPLPCAMDSYEMFRLCSRCFHCNTFLIPSWLPMLTLLSNVILIEKQNSDSVVYFHIVVHLKLVDASMCSLPVLFFVYQLLFPSHFRICCSSLESAGLSGSCFAVFMPPFLSTCL